MLKSEQVETMVCECASMGYMGEFDSSDVNGVIEYSIHRLANLSDRYLPEILDRHLLIGESVRNALMVGYILGRESQK